jgi:hypothetical protein
VKALYWQPPDPTELAAIGLTPEDFPPPEFTLWASNWPAIQFYTRISTQWRVGASGAAGLDYNVVFHELDRKGLKSEDYEELMAQIRVIEETALQILHEKKP